MPEHGSEVPVGREEGTVALRPGAVIEDALLVICEVASCHASEEDADCLLDAIWLRGE